MQLNVQDIVNKILKSHSIFKLSVRNSKLKGIVHVDR